MSIEKFASVCIDDWKVDQLEKGYALQCQKPFDQQKPCHWANEHYWRELLSSHYVVAYAWCHKDRQYKVVHDIWQGWVEGRTSPV